MSMPVANAKQLSFEEVLEILRGLAWETALFAFALVGLFCAAVVAVEVFVWFKSPATDAGSRGRKLKTLLRSGHFWIASSCTVIVAACLNIVPYYRTYGTCTRDGCEVAGWPMDFWVCGGFVFTMYFDKLALAVDVLVAVAVAAGVGIGFRNGMRPLLNRARAWMRKVRAWPRDDES